MTAARILVVEDSRAIRLPVVTALSAQGFELASATDGDDLEKLLTSFVPDLVILDVRLPGRDGFVECMICGVVLCVDWGWRQPSESKCRRERATQAVAAQRVPGAEGGFHGSG